MIDLRLDRVTYRYDSGPVALDGIDLAIPGGQSLALVGANGSGKTTLLRQLDGLLRPTTGQVLVDGMDARERRVAELAAQVALCFQDPDRQIFGTNVRDEAEFGARQLGASGEEAYARARAALDAVGLGDDLGRHPGDLGESGRKLLTIASVLAMQTPVVALDEPTIGLDRHGIDRVQRVIADLRSEGRTVIAASHDIGFVAETFERIVGLARGRIAFDGPPTEVFAEAWWPRLRSAGIEPPQATRIGARLGLGSTPTDASLVAALQASNSDDGERESS